MEARRRLRLLPQSAADSQDHSENDSGSIVGQQKTEDNEWWVSEKVIVLLGSAVALNKRKPFMRRKQLFDKRQKHRETFGGPATADLRHAGVHCSHRRTTPINIAT